MTSTVNLRFAPEILRRLGEELVPHPDLGVVELVRNAYDADAQTCTVELYHINRVGGSIIVTDTGDGMSESDIVDGWLLLGKSSKTGSLLTPNGRRKVGEKGLGRLAALRLGRLVELTTRPRSEPGVQYVLKIDWQSFDSVEAVEDVKLSITKSSTTDQPGTRIQISEITDAFTDKDVERLARALVLLTGPFPGPDDFSVTLNVPEFQSLATIVHQSFFDEAEYRIVASLDDSGQASAKLYHWSGEELASGDHFAVSSAGADRGTQPAIAYLAPAAKFELWVYILSESAFITRGSTMKVQQVRSWLKSVGGVHLYHRNLRVHPYGDQGHDWLEMNLRRVRSPELRPGTNTSVGRISVVDEAQLLRPKTDRTGFLETTSFVELARFGRNVLDWAAQEQMRRRKKRQDDAQQQADDKMAEAIQRLDATVRRLPREHQELVRDVANDLREAFEEKVKAVEDDLLLYRTLGTVGTTTAVFAHETKQPVDLIESASKSIARRGPRLLKDTYQEQLGGQVDIIQEAAASLKTYANIPLQLLHRRKRRAGVVDVNKAVEEIAELFSPHLAGADVYVELQLLDVPAPVAATVSSVEAIVANLLANATYAFTQPQKRPTPTRLIVIRTSLTPEMVMLSVLDNGPGIDTTKLNLRDIWLPGATTREDGTGLGLTIVKDVVRDLRGEVYAKAEGELGGAEFNIEIPRAKS